VRSPECLTESQQQLQTARRSVTAHPGGAKKSASLNRQPDKRFEIVARSRRAAVSAIGTGRALGEKCSRRRVADG
jgi:hypothetical protein